MEIAILREMILDMKDAVEINLNHSTGKWECVTDYNYMGIGNTPGQAFNDFLNMNDEAIIESYREMMSETKRDEEGHLWSLVDTAR